MTAPARSKPAVQERPLTGFARLRVVSGALLGLAVFYVVALGVILALLVLLLLELAVALVMARFGMVRLMASVIQRHTRLMVLLLRSGWLRSGAEFRIGLTEPEAPALFALVQALAARFGVPPPREILIEMNAGAWVELNGFRQGAKQTRLGIGYDLLAGLSEAEVEAVIAHELAHAKYVQRGLKRALNKGLARAAQASNALSQLVQAYRRANASFVLAEKVLAVIRGCTLLTARRIAAYSRQDEFEADRGAADACGPEPLCSALRRVEGISTVTARVGWTERVSRLQAPGGFAAWLSETLQTSPTAAFAGRGEFFDPYSTHPTTSDRIAALAERPAPTAPARPGRPALSLFAAPDAVARRLVAEIHRKIRIEEQRDSRERAKWLRRVRRRAKLRPLQLLAVVLILVAPFIAWAGWTGAIASWPVLIALGLIGVGVALFRLGRFRRNIPVPVPTFEAIRAAQQVKDDPATREARRTAIEKELEDSMQGSRARAKFAAWRDTALAAIGRGEALRAFACFRRMESLDARAVENDLIAALALAGLRANAAASINALAVKTGLRTPGALWAAAWALYLNDQPDNAEPMLQELHDRDPAQPTFSALLATCQARRNKLQSALGNARDAYEADPTSRARGELLVDLLMSAGELDQAETILGRLNIGDDPGLILSMVRLQLLRANFDAAHGWSERLKAVAGARGHHLLGLGGLYESSRRDELAAAAYAAALAAGYYPAAELGLARLAAHRGDRDLARRHALAALDTTRELAPESINPLGLFAVIMALLREMEGRVDSAKAWHVKVPVSEAIGPLRGHTFLVYATSAESAVAYVVQALTATRPALPPVMSTALSVQLAAADEQPIRAVFPGIQ